MRVFVQLIGADKETAHFAAVNTRIEGGFFVVTEHFNVGSMNGTRSLTTRYPVARIAWVKEES